MKRHFLKTATLTLALGTLFTTTAFAASNSGNVS